MIQKTKNYEMFKLSDRNRDKISINDVNKIVESIKYRNLLHLRPIVVDGNYTILDGNHRYLAAKQLGVDIYYDMKEDLQISDMLILNSAKAWGLYDYLNFFVRENYEEYIKLKEFMDKYNFHLKQALGLLGIKGEEIKNFRTGKFKFESIYEDSHIDCCLKMISTIKEMIGYKGYIESSRFFQACAKLTLHPDFNFDKLIYNLRVLSSRICPKTSMEEYYQMLREIHNFKNPIKIAKEYDPEV